MELHELRSYKGELESRLKYSIAKDLKWFEEKTDWSVEAIDVRMLDITTFGDKLPRYTLKSVVVKLEEM